MLGLSSLKSLTGNALTGVLAICSGVSCGGEPAPVCAPGLTVKRIAKEAKTESPQRSFMRSSLRAR